MRASCRNVHAVVTECAADYHLRMPATQALRYSLIERAGPGERVQWRAQGDACGAVIAATAYRGAEPPRVLTSPRLEAAGAGAWRIAAREGSFEFSARAVDAIEERPLLFATLHAPFGVTARERFAARCLLALLRLPGGAGLLRRWHAGRT